jgi:hypothetical protein
MRVGSPGRASTMFGPASSGIGVEMMVPVGSGAIGAPVVLGRPRSAAG